MPTKRKIFTKRLLALTLTLVMIFGVISPMSIAASEENTALSFEEFERNTQQVFQPQPICPDEDWAAISNILDGIYGRWDDIRTAYNGAIMREIPFTALMGNGDVFASTAGNADQFTLNLSKHDFWTTHTGGGPNSVTGGANPIRVGGVTISELREEYVSTNLAQFATRVTASHHLGSNPPTRAVDGTVTYGSGLEGWVTEHFGHTNMASHWMVLEFDEPITFGRYNVMADAWARHQYSVANGTHPRALRVQTSNDGVTWIDVDTVTDNNALVISRELNAPVTTRFVRLYIDQPEQNVHGTSRARIARFELLDSAPTENRNFAPEHANVWATGHYQSFLPVRAVDGTVTANSGLEGWVGPNFGSLSDDRWHLVLQFDEPVTIGGFAVMGDAWGRPHYNVIGQGGTNPRNFTLQVGNPAQDALAWNSADRIWDTIYTVTDNYENMVFRNLDTYAQGVRWVRLEITRAQWGANGNMSRARVARFELYPSSGEVTPDPEPKEYLKIQDIRNAEVRTDKYIGDTLLHMESFIAANHNLTITKVTSGAEHGTPAARLSAETFAPAYMAHFPATVEVFDDYVMVTRTTRAPGEHFNNMGVRNGWRSRVAISTRLIGADNVQTREVGPGRAALDFYLAPGQTVYIVTAVGGGGQTYRWQENQNTLHVAAQLSNLIQNPEITITPEAQSVYWLNQVSVPDDIYAIRDNHRAWWRDYWTASWVWLDDAGDGRITDAMRYYYGAQYMLGMVTREGFIAPGLQGHWHTTDNPQWDSDYHLNYNFQATWYGVYSSNRPEQAISAIRAILDYMEIGRLMAENTARLRAIAETTFMYVLPRRPLPPYGQVGTNIQGDWNYVDYLVERGSLDPVYGVQGGIILPVAIAPWGTTIGDGTFHNQTLCAPFSAYLMTEFFRYVPDLDREFLLQIYEFVKGTATFQEAWLQWVPERGENGEYVLIAGFNEGSWALNPAAELAAHKLVFDNAIAISEYLGVDEERRERWTHIREHMADQPILDHYTAHGVSGPVFNLAERYFQFPRTQAQLNQGMAREWRDRMSPRPPDGNMMVMESVIPGGILGFFSPPEDLEIARRTISSFGNHGFRHHNNFPKAFPTSVRVGYDVNTVIGQLSYLVRRDMAPNLRITDSSAHGPEKAGTTAAINSMMLAGHNDTIMVFPNWFAGRDASFARLRAPGGFVVSADYTNGNVENLMVHSTAGGEVSIVHPWLGSEYNYIAVVKSDGSRIDVTTGHAPYREEMTTFTFATVSGETYWIFPTSKQEAPPVVFTGNNPNVLRELLSQSDVLLQTTGNLGIFTHHSPFVIPEGRTLTVVTTLNVQGNAELIINGTLVVQDGGRVNNQGGAGGTIRIANGGRLVNYGHVENVTNSAVINYGTIVNNARFEVRAHTRLHNCGEIIGTINVHRDANICYEC